MNPQQNLTREHPDSAQLIKASYVENETRQPDPRDSLENAVLSFLSVLDDSQRLELQNAKVVPDSDDVLIFTAELDFLNRDRKGPSVASKLFSVLQSVRDFSNIVDTISFRHSKLSLLVWGSIRTAILVGAMSIRHFVYI